MQDQKNPIAPLKATMAVMLVVSGFIFSNTVFAGDSEASTTEADVVVAQLEAF